LIFRAGRMPVIPQEEEPMPTDEAAIEKEIQAKGLNAPRLTPTMIDAVIVSEDYFVFPGTTLTICALRLRNGFLVTGESAAASPENFDPFIGRKIARENARRKIWQFEGYLLREKLSINNIEKIAETCHQANKSLCEAFGDGSQVDWKDAPQWQRHSAIAGVKFCIENPNAPPSANHDSWLAEKRRSGWVYGEVKDPEAKTHPCFVHYDELPADQKAKDHVFKAIVAALA
jgi:hypothetical protein